MRGWTPDGKEIELLPWQEQAVKMFMENTEDNAWGTVLMLSRGYGKSVVTATIKRIKENMNRTGEWFPDDPAG